MQPLVIYLTAYDPGDCDDKAVHYYSAAYFSAPQERKNLVASLYKNQSQEADGNFPERTVFRLESAYYYPLADILINAFSIDNAHFADAVKYGLLAVTIVAIAAVVAISSKTPLGFWQSVLVINLIAFYSIKLHFIVEQVPRNMHPFITYVPRGAAALMIIPAILTFAARKPALFILSLATIFLFHVGSAMLIIPIVLVSAVIFLIFERLKLTKSRYFYLLFPTGIIGGVDTFVSTVAIGFGIWLVDTFKASKSLEFYKKAFYFGSLTLFVSTFTSAVASQPRVTGFITAATGSATFSEIPQRLTGVQYSILVLLVVLFARLMIDYLQIDYFKSKKRIKIKVSVVVISVLIILSLNHLSEYLWVVKRVSGFFLPSCTAAQSLSLPRDMNKLKLLDEPSFFVTLGNYLLNK